MTPLSHADIKIINASFMTRSTGIIVHETFIMRLPVIGTPFVMPASIIHFQGVLPAGCSVYKIVYLVRNIQVDGMVIVRDGESFETACLNHYTEQRDITHAPIHFHKDNMN